jgi:hypothetical protein
MDVSSTGKNFSVIISCLNTPYHHQMAFASWYSFAKNLPDANVEIAVRRSEDKVQLFSWARKVGVKFYFHNYELNSRDGIIVLPTVMAIRAFDEKFLGPVSVKAVLQTTLVDCAEGCGKFVEQIGIDTKSSFLHRATKRYLMENMTANELRVLKLWEKAAFLYQAL